MVLLHSLVATLVVSVLPNLFLIFIPEESLKRNETKRNIRWTNIFICFAIGGLLGDVFIHVIPHMLSPHDHSDHDHGHEHGHSLDPHSSHVHQHEHQREHDEQKHDHAKGTNQDEELQTCPIKNPNCTNDQPVLYERERVTPHKDNQEEHDHDTVKDKLLKKHPAEVGQAGSSFEISRNTFLLLMVLLGFFLFFLAEKVTKKLLRTNHSHEHHPVTPAQEPVPDAQIKKQGTSNVPEEKRTWKVILKSITATGYLNLLADFMHNFTDGIALGISFATGKRLGITTFLSVIAHEIPHEVGDFSLLVQNGLSKYEAISAQFVTAVGALTGTFFGYYMKEHESHEHLLLALSSGGFLYIATVAMLPAILEEDSTFQEIVYQSLAFLSGIGLMIFVLWVESLDGHHH